MADETTKTKNSNLEGLEDAAQESRSSSTKVNSDKSTTTETNGGTRSSPPRVGGSGRGEANSVKAGDASKAKSSAALKDAEK